MVEALVALSRPRRDGTGRWTEYASALGDPYLEFVAAETVASAIIAYAPLQVPELLQVPAYDRASAAADAGAPEEWEAAVTVLTCSRSGLLVRPGAVWQLTDAQR